MRFWAKDESAALGSDTPPDRPAHITLIMMVLGLTGAHPPPLRLPLLSVRESDLLNPLGLDLVNQNNCRHSTFRNSW